MEGRCPPVFCIYREISTPLYSTLSPPSSLLSLFILYSSANEKVSVELLDLPLPHRRREEQRADALLSNRSWRVHLRNTTVRRNRREDAEKEVFRQVREKHIILQFIRPCAAITKPSISPPSPARGAVNLPNRGRPPPLPPLR